MMVIRRASLDEEQWGRDWNHLVKHHDYWFKELGPKWVAVYKGQRVALSDSLERMYDQVEQSGCPKHRVAFIRLGELILNPEII